MQRSYGCTLLCLLLLGAPACQSELDDPDDEQLQSNDEQALRWALPPGIQVWAAGPLVTSETGQTAQFWVSLRSPPSALVKLGVASTAPDEGTVKPAQLRFNALDWWLPRRVLVTGQSDQLADGDVKFDVTLTPSSNDPRYAALPPAVAHVVNRDASAFQLLANADGSLQMSEVFDLSHAGDVAVGVHTDAALAQHAVRWSTDTLLTMLNGEATLAAGVSPDGALIVGSQVDSRFTGGRAAVIWRSPNGQPERFQEPPIPPFEAPGWQLVVGTAVTNAGVVFGNCVQYGNFYTVACRTPIVMSNMLLSASILAAISPDGAHWVGTVLPTRYGPPWTYAVRDGQQLPFPSALGCLTPSSCSAYAEDISDDGSLLVGRAQLWPSGTTQPPSGPSNFHAVTYRDAWSRLPDLAGGEEQSGARAVTGDGSVIAGFGTDDGGQQAVLWRAGQPFSVRALLSSAGATIPDGFQLSEVVALSQDGRILVGNGTHADGAKQAWRAVLTTP